MPQQSLSQPPGYEDYRPVSPRTFLHVRADKARQAQREAREGIQPSSEFDHAALGIPPHLIGKTAPTAKYHDIPIIEDDDMYFRGEWGEQPYHASPKPPYFDDYEQACRKDDVAAVLQVTSQNSLTPAMLHHGLTLALSAGSAECARQLLVCGAPLAQRAPEEVVSAPSQRRVALLDVLVEHGWTPTHDLFMESIPDVPLMHWFLSHGANPNHGTKRDTPSHAGGPSDECADALERAAHAGSAEAVEVLIAAGAKVAFGTPLHSAAGTMAPGQMHYGANARQSKEFDESRIPAMAVLVANGADVNQMEDTPHMTPSLPLVYAVSAGAVERARWLLEHGAAPDLKGSFGSAANYAAKMGSVEMKELFSSWESSN